MMSFDDERIRKFLVRAKRATYAGKGAEYMSSRPASHDFRYSEDDLLYIDTYVGGLRFSGEEAAWVDGAPVWAMNYTGRVIADGFSGDFLKAALRSMPADFPCRGPRMYEEGDYRYEMEHTGDFSWYEGRETIYYKNVPVYECLFHGGITE